MTASSAGVRPLLTMSSTTLAVSRVMMNDRIAFRIKSRKVGIVLDPILYEPIDQLIAPNTVVLSKIIEGCSFPRYYVESFPLSIVKSTILLGIRVIVKVPL